MTTKELRPYQSDAIQAIYDYFADKNGNPLIEIPTAGGKSLVMAKFIEGVMKAHPGERILIVTHVQELIEQDLEELLEIWPAAPAGVYSAGLNRREINPQVLFAGIQSIHRVVAKVGRVDLVLIDEAHLIPRRSNTMYCQFLKRLKLFNPMLKVIGFTATPFRLDSGMLHEGDGAVFTDIAYKVSVRKLIDEGYLSNLVTKKMKTELDVSGVGSRAGEFIASELEAAIDKDHITKGAVEEICSYGKNRNKWLVFCSGVQHAFHVRDALRARGVSCETIVGNTSSKERAQIIERFRNGELRCLTNANVLTTGFNVPNVDLIAMLRPTQSAGLYVQIVGRGLRKADGKNDCLILDFANNISRHGPIDAIEPKRKGKGKDKPGEPPLKVCPNCKSFVHAGARECPDCGHHFPPPQIQISATASTLSILSTGKPEWVAVDAVSYALHNKPGSPSSLRVDYRCGLITHREWICFEHEGYPQKRARNWWAVRAPTTPVPTKVTEALRAVTKLRRPTAIAVKANGRYTEVVNAKFS